MSASFIGATLLAAATSMPEPNTTLATAAVVGVITTLIVSWALSRTVLRGEPSAFILELPPYRRPNVLQILYTSLIDRTMLVLMRAIIIAAPAGGIIWLMAI